MYNEQARIKDFKQGSEVVGYYRNYGCDIPITVNDIKNYVPKHEWDITMSSAVKEYKELNSN